MTAAYFHVLADTLTSVLAIIALLLGKYFGWTWLDPAIGIVGAVIIAKWSFGLIRNSSHILLDKGIDQETREQVVAVIEEDRDNRVVDLHAWHLNPQSLALIVSIVTHAPKNPRYYRNLLSKFDFFSHITVEVNACKGPACIPIDGLEEGR